MDISRVQPKQDSLRTHDLVLRARARDDEQRRLLSNYLLSRVMNNKVKAAIAIVLGAIVQLLKLFGIADVPDFVVDALTAVLAFVAGLFLPQPKEK